MSDELAIRRKRLKVRTRQRGTLEICVILERYLNNTSLTGESEIAEFEALLEESDHNIGLWLVNTPLRPERHRRILMEITRKLRIMDMRSQSN